MSYTNFESKQLTHAPIFYKIKDERCLWQQRTRDGGGGDRLMARMNANNINGAAGSRKQRRKKGGTVRCHTDRREKVRFLKFK